MTTLAVMLSLPISKRWPSAANSGLTQARPIECLAEAGVSGVIYSTPCLFAAQTAIAEAMRSLDERDGLLPDTGTDLRGCTAVLEANHARRAIRKRPVSTGTE